MLAIVISLLFGVAALAAMMTVAGSLAEGLRHAPRILAELNAVDRELNRPRLPRLSGQLAPPPLAAA